ncbi:hypothetical protein [Clostridium sp. DMHC 10]|uniref:hypothetical protein n=1 Tax=Clostridium sp. DMHC 10 TaxID=747377 RepID=UPI00069DE7BE
MRDGQEDIYFNKNHIHCNVGELTKGRVVSFEEGLNYKNRRPQAIKVNLLRDEDNIELLKQCVESIMFDNIELYDKLEMLWKLNWDFIEKNWNNFSVTLKIVYLYRLCRENKDFPIIENINEKNKIIRAMLLLLWSKFNGGEASMVFKKAAKLIEEYRDEIIGDKDAKRKVVSFIIPTREKGIIDVLKPLRYWSIMEFIESCSKMSIARELENSESPLINMIYAVNLYTKIK